MRDKGNLPLFIATRFLSVQHLGVTRYLLHLREFECICGSGDTTLSDDISEYKGLSQIKVYLTADPLIKQFFMAAN